MTKSHIESNAKLLSEVVVYENAERKKIKENLKEFHALIDKRTAEVKQNITANHQIKLNELEEQVAQIHSALQSQDIKELETILKKMGGS